MVFSTAHRVAAVCLGHNGVCHVTDDAVVNRQRPLPGFP